MEYLNITHQGAVAVLKMQRGKANPLNKQMFTELSQALTQLENDSNTRAVVLTGNGEFFSAGLDVIELYDYNSEELTDFFHQFHKFVIQLVSFPKVMIASVTGHSPAGGCVLALGADYRVMAQGKYRIGLNEVPVGIVVPPTIFNLYSFWIGNQRAYQYLLVGKMVTADEGVAIGLIDKAVPLEEVETEALAIANQVLRANDVILTNTKINLRKGLISSMQSFDFEATFGKLIDIWFSDDARAVLGGLVASLKK